MNCLFRGIEGSNPLGFLAALGAFRLLDLACGDVRLRWVRDGGWRPQVSGLPDVDEEGVCQLLQERAPWAPLEVFAGLGNNLTVSREVFSQAVRESVKGSSAKDRRAPDFAAAFGSDVFKNPKLDRIEYTDLCFITGSGHQHFLGTARSLAVLASPEHLREALFGPWRFADRGMSMRWDPDDAKEYALQWNNPGPEGVWGVWGANRLAFEALPLFPTMPTKRGQRTTGFQTQKRAHEFTWPIWEQAVSVDTARSLLGLAGLQTETPNRGELRAMGVEDVFRAVRVRIGQGANFKVSFRQASAV